MLILEILYIVQMVGVVLSVMLGNPDITTKKEFYYAMTPLLIPLWVLYMLCELCEGIIIGINKFKDLK